MVKTLLILGLLLSVFLIGCASFSSAPASEIESRNFSNQTSGGPAGAPAPAVAPQMEELLPSQSKAFGDDARIERGAIEAEAPVSSDGNTTLQLAQRRVISTVLRLYLGVT